MPEPALRSERRWRIGRPLTGQPPWDSHAHMKRVLTFRDHARACRELAVGMPEPHRIQPEEMAREWEAMAEERERTLRVGLVPEGRSFDGGRSR